MCVILDDLSLLSGLKFQDNRTICHILAVIMDMKPSLASRILDVFLNPAFDFLAQDQLGFTALTYGITYV